MHESFDKNEINAQIHAVCNDTVGTLLACAYDYENVRVGLILGTGSNACYIEPSPPKKKANDTERKYDDEEESKEREEEGEIINIECTCQIITSNADRFLRDEKYQTRVNMQRK